MYNIVSHIKIDPQVVVKLDYHYLCIKLLLFTAPLVAQMVRNMPAMQEIWIWSLGQKDSLEKGMATHSIILTCIIPWTEEPGGLQSVVSQRVGHNWVTDIIYV